MDVLFVAILAMPLILGKFTSLPELSGQVFYRKWNGRRQGGRGSEGEGEEQLRDAIQWGVINTLSSALHTVQCWGWRGIRETQPGRGEESRVLSKKKQMMRMKPQNRGGPHKRELGSPSLQN